MPLIYAYLGLAASAFTSATILPGTSEAAFAAFIYNYPEQAYGAWLCAGLTNGLGSMVSYWMGRLIPSKKRSSEKPCACSNAGAPCPFCSPGCPLSAMRCPLPQAGSGSTPTPPPSCS